MPSRGQYWKVGGINDKHVIESDLDQALQDKVNAGVEPNLVHTDEANKYDDLLKQEFRSGFFAIRTPTDAFEHRINIPLSALDRDITFPDATTTLLGTNNTASVSNKNIDLTANTVNDSGALGDLIKHNDAKYVNFPKGTADQLLRINSAGTDLEYFTPSTPDFLFADLSADQTTNLGVNDHVEWDTIIESSSLTLSTGSGQANGIIGNLKADTVYLFEAGLTVAGSTNSAELQYQFRDNTGTPQLIGQLANSIMVSSNLNVSFQPIVSAIHKTGGEVSDAELRVILSSSVTAIESDFAYLRIMELTR